jgi:hypothetical protein
MTFATDGSHGAGAWTTLLAPAIALMIATASCTAPPAEEPAAEEEAMVEVATPAMAGPENASVERGRELVIRGACGDCHGGGPNPASTDYLVGVVMPIQEFPVIADPSDPRVYLTRPRNLTPHEETGIGRFTERQIFNAIRFGLRPGETPDVEITSNIPGQGNFPANPHYLAPPMPWPAFRHWPDQDLWDIAAYLKRGLRPVDHLVADSEGPPDFWAAFYATNPWVGTYPPPPFPTAQEVAAP